VSWLSERAARIVAIWNQSPVWLKSGVSICLTVLLTSGIKDLWDAPRPRIDITSCGIGLTHPKRPVEVPDGIGAIFANHQYLNDILDNRHTAGDYQDALAEEETTFQNFRLAESYFDTLINIVNTQSAAISRDARRLQFLKAMYLSAYDGVLEQQMKFTIDDYERSLPPGYNRHPSVEYPGHVNMGTSIITMTEIDEEQTVTQIQQRTSNPNAGDERLLDAHRTNVFRRIIGVYDPNVVVGLLVESKNEMHKINENTRYALGVLRNFLAKEAPSGWKVTALVTNRGGRALTVLNTGVLLVEVPGTKSGDKGKILIDLESADTTGDQFLVVEAQKAAILRLVSKQSVDSIVAHQPGLLGGSDWRPGGDTDASRLMKLYSARVGDLKASLILARAGSAKVGERIGGSASFPIGRKWEETVLEKLK